MGHKFVNDKLKGDLFMWNKVESRSVEVEVMSIKILHFVKYYGFVVNESQPFIKWFFTEYLACV